MRSPMCTVSMPGRDGREGLAHAGRAEQYYVAALMKEAPCSPPHRRCAGRAKAVHETGSHSDVFGTKKIDELRIQQPDLLGAEVHLDIDQITEEVGEGPAYCRNK